MTLPAWWLPFKDKIATILALVLFSTLILLIIYGSWAVVKGHSYLYLPFSLVSLLWFMTFSGEGVKPSKLHTIAMILVMIFGGLLTWEIYSVNAPGPIAVIGGA
jgi:hypothetical protein